MVSLLRVQEMAEILGVTQESVSRVLAGFKRSEILLSRSNGASESWRFDKGRLLEQALR